MEIRLKVLQCRECPLVHFRQGTNSKCSVSNFKAIPTEWEIPAWCPLHNEDIIIKKIRINEEKSTS